MRGGERTFLLKASTQQSCLLCPKKSNNISPASPCLINRFHLHVTEAVRRCVHAGIGILTIRCGVNYALIKVITGKRVEGLEGAVSSLSLSIPGPRVAWRDVQILMHRPPWTRGVFKNLFFYLTLRIFTFKNPYLYLIL